MINATEEKMSWEEYLTLGMEARADKDNCQWKLGDLALLVAKDYGKDSIGKYSYAIGVERKTLMNYRTIASRFTRQTREQYRKLSFSHFSALSALEKPEAWLEKADNNDWNVETLRKSVKDAYKGIIEVKLTNKPPKVYECPKCHLWRLEGMSSFDICRGHYTTNEKGETIYE